METEFTYEINGTAFYVSEGEKGWIWSTRDDEGNWCETRLEALQDAINYTSARELADRIQAEEDAEDAKYGSYEQQVRSHYNATRL